jgi:hypothetical protein
VVTSANGFIAFMESSAANAAATCYSSLGTLNPGADTTTGAFTINSVAAFKKVSDAPLGTIGTYNMATSTFVINVAGCTYTLKLNSTSPGNIVSSGKTSSARTLSALGTPLLGALAALILAAPMWS